MMQTDDAIDYIIFVKDITSQYSYDLWLYRTRAK